MDFLFCHQSESSCASKMHSILLGCNGGPPHTPNSGDSRPLIFFSPCISRESGYLNSSIALLFMLNMMRGLLFGRGLHVEKIGYMGVTTSEKTCSPNSKFLQICDSCESSETVLAREMI